MDLRERNKKTKRNSIMDAAAAAYQQDGYKQTSMDRIAELAQASKRTVYNHFESKEALFLAVARRYLAEQNVPERVPFNTEIPLEKQLQTFADFMIYLVETPHRRGLAKVLTSVFIYDPELAMEIRKGHTSHGELLIQWLNEAVDEGALSIQDIPSAAGFFFSMVEGVCTWPALFQECTVDFFHGGKTRVIKAFLALYRTER